MGKIKMKQVSISAATHEVLQRVKTVSEAKLGRFVSINEAAQISASAYFELEKIKVGTDDEKAIH